MRKDDVPTARRGWQDVESAQWKALADDLRKFGLKAPIAGGSHWRREPEYCRRPGRERPRSDRRPTVL